MKLIYQRVWPYFESNRINAQVLIILRMSRILIKNCFFYFNSNLFCSDSYNKQLANQRIGLFITKIT